MTGLPALLGALGLVGIVFALLSFLVAIFGAPGDLAADMMWIGGNFAVGLVLLGVAVAMSFETLRERATSGEGRRAGKYGTSAILGTLLAIVLVTMLGFLSTRYHARFDWSEGQVHSLSDQSKKVLAGLDRDARVIALYSTLDMEPARQLLDRYAYESPKFQVEYADPNKRPDLLEANEITPEELGQGLVRVTLGDESVNVSDLSEESVTNAMVKLSRGERRQVYFLEGHNERAVQGEGAQVKEGYARAAEALRNENYDVEPLLLASRGDVPDDADAVVVAGATRPVLDAERNALERYLARGGRLLVLVDPRANTDLVDAVRAWGVDVGDDIIIDRQLALFGRATSPFAGGYDETHAITRGMRETTLFHVARSVRPSGAPGAEFTELVFTGDQSWAERDLDRFFADGSAELGAGDVRGPVTIGVAGKPALNGSTEAGADASGEDVDARLVVFGDADFASNELIEAYLNRDLFVNAVNWLIGDVEAISIRPRQSRASRFQLSIEQFRTIRTASLFILPEALAILGVLVWWSRRQTPNR